MRTIILSSFSITVAILLGSLFLCVSSGAEVESLRLIDVFTTLPGETAQVGRFEVGTRIDLVFEFEVDADEVDEARLTWDVYNRYGRVVFSAEREVPCEVGANSVRIDNAIPTDLGTGWQKYEVYASVRVEDEKEDVEFEIRVGSERAFPGVIIEDVRLKPREDEEMIPELTRAAIAYTLEVDFRVESIISWAPAEIHWHGVTSEGFDLDRGVAALTVDEGFNTFATDSFIARPSVLAEPEAEFTVIVDVIGYTDAVTFPIESLPVSLVELRARLGVEQDEGAFSVGEAYMVTGDGARAAVFNRREPVVARLETNGFVPENTVLYMTLSGGPNEMIEEFVQRLESGRECPNVDYELPREVERKAGFYDFTWSLVIGDTLFAERRTHLTLSDRQGVSIPIVVELPGPARITVPITWQATEEADPDRYATLVTENQIVCEILGQSMDEPLNPGFIADIWESESSLSNLPPGATLLTEERAESEGLWEFVQRAYLGDGKVFVNDYWTYRSGAGEYQFLMARCVGSEDQIEETYYAANMIRENLSFEESARTRD